MEKPREEGCCLDATPAWKHSTCVDGGVEKLNAEDFSCPVMNLVIKHIVNKQQNKKLVRKHSCEALLYVRR